MSATQTISSSAKTPVDGPDGLTPVDLTYAQRAIMAALDNKDGGSTHVMDRPPSPSAVFWEVALGLIGVMSLLVGVVLMFFFAALGGILLALGAVTCVLAFGSAHTEAVAQQSHQTATARRPVDTQVH